MEEMTKEELEAYRKELLKQYHAKKEELEYAEDEMEEGWIEETLEKYRTAIRTCIKRIGEMEEEEQKA